VLVFIAPLIAIALIASAIDEAIDPHDPEPREEPMKLQHPFKRQADEDFLTERSSRRGPITHRSGFVTPRVGHGVHRT
jgi:hypothetical protein